MSKYTSTIKRRATLTAGALALPLFGLALAAYAGAKPFGAQATPANQLFAQSLPDTAGRTQNLAQWKGKLLVVNFWATWCSPCVKEMPELSTLQTDLAPRGVQVLGVGVDTAANIGQFSSKYAISYPLYTAGQDGTALLAKLGNRAGSLPFTLLIGRDGAIRKTYLGRLDMDTLRRDLRDIGV